MEKYFVEIRRQSGTPPDEIFHYTTPDGLLGIIGARAFKATSAFHLNDAQENRIASRLAIDLINERLKNPRDRAEASFLTTVRSGLEVLGRYPSGVVCFSEERDLLSQWRAYSQGHGAISIGMDTKLLASWGDNGFFLARCVYDTSAQGELLHVLLDDACDRFTSGFQPVEKDQAKGTKVFTEAVARTVAGIGHASTFFKHPSFSEEREWRVVCPVFSADGSDAKFRATRSRLVPYKELDLSAVYDKIFRSVTIGPTPHRESAEYAARLFLNAKGLGSTPVLLSECPFVSW